MQPAQRRLAERRLLTALARAHRHEPMRPWLRADTVLRDVREAPLRPSSHRGAQPLGLTDTELRAVLAALAEEGEIEMIGAKVRLASRASALGAEMRRRADELLAELRAAGASPPRAEAVARRIGLPEAVVDGLRQSGELVSAAPGVDYPADVLDALLGRLAGRELSVADVRDELGTTRRFAAALLEAAELRRRH